MICFYKAFNNYFVEIPNNDLFWQKRWEQAGVNYDLSFGMFQDEKLIGFIIHAVDSRNEIGINNTINQFEMELNLV